ncbi:MAG: HAD-IA family hydrolase [Planctomycetota bacterium]|nr:HAD-IA family hydrolase [Planctomycetota bacterium]MDA1212325.1 HAD-IA family hydrolase [Planctomycetota bacterium]
MTKAFLFDIDGVLIKPMQFATVLERDFGLTAEITDSFFTGPFERCLLGQADLREELPPFLEKWRWPLSLDAFVDRWFSIDSILNAEMLAFSASMRYMGIPCYLASTQEKHRAAYLESTLEFDRLFDGCFFSCRLGCKKPELEFFQQVTSQLDIDPTEIQFFDDRRENVEAARLVGWEADQYFWGVTPYVELGE